MTRATNRDDALRVTTRSHTYHLIFGGGSAVFPDGLTLESESAFAVLRDMEKATMIDGTSITLEKGGKRHVVVGEANALRSPPWRG